MSKTAALRLARADVRMSRQGRGWVVGDYDPQMRAWCVGQERTYWQARTETRDSRAYRALRLMGWSDERAAGALHAAENGPQRGPMDLRALVSACVVSDQFRRCGKTRARSAGDAR